MFHHHNGFWCPCLEFLVSDGVHVKCTHADKHLQKAKRAVNFSFIIVYMLCNELLYMLYYDSFWAYCDPTLTFCFLFFFLNIRVEDSANKDYPILHFYQMIKKIRKNKQEKKYVLGFMVHS